MRAGAILLIVGLAVYPGAAQQPAPRAGIDGTEIGWRALGEADFVNINTSAGTWTWQPDAIASTGTPIGVSCSKQPFTNFEVIVEWRLMRLAGNSGLFLWVPSEALKDLKPDTLPSYGIEIQMLDHGYTQQYERQSGKKADWFTTNGDVFAVGSSKLTPFPPVSPNGSRSFPRKQLSRGVGEWNHYYVRAINGEVRLWVNGEEVSGGRDAQPRTGSICLEAEGAPIEFRHLRIREVS